MTLTVEKQNNFLYQKAKHLLPNYIGSDTADIMFRSPYCETATINC